MTGASPEISRPKPSRWWRGRRLRLFVILAILLMLLARIGLDWWTGRRLQAVVTRLEQKYGSIDGRSIVGPHAPPEDNRARIVMAATALMTPHSVDRGFSAVMSSLNSFDSLPDSTRLPADLRAFAENNRTALRLLDEARSRRQSSWDADYAGADHIWWMDIRALADAAYVAALVDLETGRPDDAARAIASGVTVGASLRQEPVLIGQLIRMAIALQQCNAARRLIAGSEPSRAALEELAVALVESRTWDPVRIGLIGELKVANAGLTKMENGEVSSLQDQANVSIWAGPLLWAGRPIVRLGRIDALQEFERLIDIQAGPRPRPAFPEASGPGFLNWRGLTRTLAHWGWDSAWFPLGLQRSIETGDVFYSAVGATEVGVALRRYRLDHGTYPDDLAALAPTYLERVPIDPFTGRPPVYARAGTGFTLKATGGTGAALATAAVEWVVAK